MLTRCFPVRGRIGRRLPLVLLCITPVLAAPAADEAVRDAEIRLLREELSRLRDRVDSLETQLRSERGEDAAPVARGAATSAEPATVALLGLGSLLIVRRK